VGAAVVLLAAFVVIELRTTHPLLPMRVILERNRGGSFLGSFLAGIGLFGMFLFLTYYLQGTLGYSALKTGFAFLPFSGGIIVAAGLASRLLPRVGPRPLMAGGFLASALGIAWMTQIGVHSSFAVHVLPAEIVMSLGLGLAFVPLSSTALIGVGDHDAGVASAMVNTTQQIGGSLGTALLNTIASTATASYVASHRHSASAAAHSLVHGYNVAFSYAAGALLLAAIVSALLVHAKKDDVAAIEGTPALA
jgi:MFS family permease